MMTVLTDLFQIDGKPMPAPDEGVELSFSDLDAADAGRDESGIMHRVLVRSKVPTWQFCYSCLSQQDYAYLQGILPRGGSFVFTYPDPADCTRLASCLAYLSGYSVRWQGTSGLYKDLKFSIIAC